MFKELTSEEIKEYKKWARKNYVLAETISETWHPVIQKECATMNEEKSELLSAKMMIRQIFERIIEAAMNDENRSGCFLINTAVELAPHDEQIAACVKEATQQMEDRFHKLLSQAQQSGDIAF